MSIPPFGQRNVLREPLLEPMESRITASLTPSSSSAGTGSSDHIQHSPPSWKPELQYNVERTTKEASEASALSERGYMYLNGLGGLRRDLGKAQESFVEAAEKGDSSAMFHLGHMYEKILITTRYDRNPAVDWYARAAEQNNTTAMFRLGKIYQKGSCGVEKNEQIALEYFTQAAAGGHPGATQEYNRLRLEKVPQKKSIFRPWR